MEQDELRDLINGTAQIAQIVVNYYFELKQCGMGDEQALRTAINYQNTIVRNAIDAEND